GAERRARVQTDGPYRDGRPRKPAGTVAWWEHEEAHRDYATRHHGQSAQRIHERGGFGYWGDVAEWALRDAAEDIDQPGQASVVVRTVAVWLRARADRIAAGEGS